MIWSSPAGHPQGDPGVIARFLFHQQALRLGVSAVKDLGNL